MNARRMRGVYVVEFAIVGLLLFVLLFGVLEMGRLFFTVNALNETVRRGARLAAVCNIDDPRILRRAIFNAADETGTSGLIANLDTSDLRLVYLDANGAEIAPADLRLLHRPLDDPDNVADVLPRRKFGDDAAPLAVNRHL